ncbi:MAG: hypothetical protein WBP12_01415 [Candidatus Saccharimonas sp.]
MPRDVELDRLKAVQDRTFHGKQAAYQVQQRAWEKRDTAREAMNRAYDAKQNAWRAQDDAWQYLQGLRARNGPRIDALNTQQERAFQDMKSAFDSASAAHESRDGASARSYADQGHAYKAESQGCVAERRSLVAEIRSARDAHDALRPAFQQAKSDFDACRQVFNTAKAEHERAQAEFRRANAEFDAASAAYKARLDKVKVESQKRRDDKKAIAIKAGVPQQYCDNVWISRDRDGNTNIYFGGVGKPNGPGHGHYVLDRNDNVTYRRDPFDPHGAQNFTDDNGRGGTLYDRSARPGRVPKGVSTRNNETHDRSGVFYQRNNPIDLHVTQYYDDKQHVSWDTDGQNDRNRHWTDQARHKGDPDRHTPPSGTL